MARSRRSKTRAVPPPPTANRRPLWVVAATLVVFGAAIALALYLSRPSPPPVAPAPPPQSPHEATDPAFRAAVEKAQQNPQDADAAAAVAHEYIVQERYDEATQLTERALAENPAHLESLIHREVLRAARGDVTAALEGLGALLKAHPDAPEALYFHGALAYQVGDYDAALRSFERFAALTPPAEQPPQLKEALQTLREAVVAPQ